jgi:hypothetical protein
MIKPLELLLYLRGLGGDLIDGADAFPGLLALYCVVGEPDGPTLAALDIDFRICVKAGWIAQYQHASGMQIHVRPAGHAMCAVLDAVDDEIQANAPTPYGDV